MEFIFPYLWKESFHYDADTGARRGMTMVAMEEKLRESAETYNKLKEAGVLVVRDLN